MTENKMDWGARRSAAQQQRLENLDSVECWYIIKLLEEQPDHEHHAATIEKLKKIAEFALEKH